MFHATRMKCTMPGVRRELKEYECKHLRHRSRANGGASCMDALSIMPASVSATIHFGKWMNCNWRGFIYNSFGEL